MNELYLQSSNPITVDDVTYDRFALSFVVSPVIKNDSVSASVVIRLRPYRIDENEQIQVLEGHDKTIIIKDALEAAQSDQALGLSFAAITSELQTYINAKGL